MDIIYANKASRLKTRGVVFMFFSWPLISFYSFNCSQLQDFDQIWLIDVVKDL